VGVAVLVGVVAVAVVGLVRAAVARVETPVADAPRRLSSIEEWLR
jgi:hypothetical protein